MLFYGKSFENAARAFAGDDTGGAIEKAVERKDVTPEEWKKIMDEKIASGHIGKDGSTNIPEESIFSKPIKRKKRVLSEPDPVDENGDTIVPEESIHFKKN